MPNSDLPSIYTGGYSMGNKKRLEKVKIPDKLKCRECKRLRTADVSFSAKQVLDFKNGLATGRIKPTQLELPWIPCRDCTSKQKTEMLCVQCLRIKGLDGFTKAQRKTPDNALCIQCVHANQTATPMDPTSDELSKRLDDDEYSDDNSDAQSNSYYQSEVGGSDSGVPVSNPSAHPLNDENLKAVSNAASYAGAWKEDVRTGAAGGKEYTAYDPQGCAHTKFRAPSVADTEESFATTRASRVSDRDMKNLTSKFARQLGPRQELQAPAEYVGGRAVEEDSDDDTDDSYGYI